MADFTTKTDEMSLINCYTKSPQQNRKCVSPSLSSPNVKPEDQTDNKTGEEEGYTRSTMDSKTKKSFCIDALLARNENKNLIASEFNLRDIRCNNELARLFRQKADQGKKIFNREEEDDTGKGSDPRKFFLDAIENRTQGKSRLFESYNVQKLNDKDEECVYESVPKLKVIRSFDAKRDINDDENGESKMEIYQESDSYLNEQESIRPSPEYDNSRREYENSRSGTPFSGKSNDTRSNSPGQSELSSPPISPGNENDYDSGKNNSNGDELRGSQIFPRPGLLVTNGPQSFMNQNPNLMLGSRPNVPHLSPHPAFLAYSNPHSFNSAFHPLNPNSPGNMNLKVGSNQNTKQGVNVSPNSGGAILGLNATGTQHLHHMQLEWLARTGMFYPRLPELAGRLKKYLKKKEKKFFFTVNENL